MKTFKRKTSLCTKVEEAESKNLKELEFSVRRKRGALRETINPYQEEKANLKKRSSRLRSE